MPGSPPEKTDFVLGLLADRLIHTRAERAQRQAAETNRSSAHNTGKGPQAPRNYGNEVVFLLGAGCSIQYGLPGFNELLQLSYRDLTGRPPEADTVLAALREELDPHWRVRKPRELRHLLRRHLRSIHGSHCPGYRRLAKLASKGLVRRIINMNFDTLLEEALEAEEVEFEVTVSFQCNRGRDGLLIYKPHGSLREDGGNPILDIVKSDLFQRHEKDEISRARDLLHNNDVVLLGYSVIDNKIADALRKAPEQGNAAEGADTPERSDADDQLGPIDHCEEGKRDPAHYQIFTANVGEPSPHLLAILEQRQSQELRLRGPEAAFGNVMEILEQRVEERQEQENGASVSIYLSEKVGNASGRALHPNRYQHFTHRETHASHFTRAESLGLARCRQLAVLIRSSMPVAEISELSIEEHAEEIFEWCLKLARSARVALTAPEKFVLHCAAYLHDLGYFSSFSSMYEGAQSGWHFLHKHGQETARLLRKHLSVNVLPKTYSRVGRKNEAEELGNQTLVDIVVSLCEHHSQPPQPGDYEKAEEMIFVEVRGCEIPVREKLLRALFNTAEELSEGHPFLPSPYPLESTSESWTSQGSIEEPILDLYLRRKPNEVTYKIHPGLVVGRLDRDSEPSDAALWMWYLAKNAVATLDTAVRTCSQSYWDHVHNGLMSLSKTGSTDGSGGRNKPEKERPPAGLGFRCISESGAKELEASVSERQRILRAIEEQFEHNSTDLVRQAETDTSQRVGLLPSLLDLLAIYTIPRVGEPIECDDPYSKELLLNRDSRGVGTILDRLVPGRGQEAVHLNPQDRSTGVDPGKIPAEGLLYQYFATWNNGKRPLLDDLLIQTVREIYYPAWRFCAAHWRSEVDSVAMARASLEFGSSHFRDEVVGGAVHLLDDKVTWERLPWVYAHDGCTLCSSRLLYIFTCLRRLMPDKDLRGKLTNADGRSFDDAAGGILRFFLAREPEDKAWSGLGIPGAAKDDRETVEAADYLAWPARALAFAISVDREVTCYTGHGWFEEMGLGKERSQIHKLLQERLASVAHAKMKFLLSPKAEEPHSYILGDVASTLLKVRSLSSDLQGMEIETYLTKAAGNLQEAVKELQKPGLSQLSRFFLWPAMVFLEEFEPPAGRNAAREDLVVTFKECFNSPVWIRSLGSGRGSWGYNLETTARLNSGLATFWRRVLEDREAFEPIFEEIFGRDGSEADKGQTKPAGRTPRAAKKCSPKTPKKD